MPRDPYQFERALHNAADSIKTADNHIQNAQQNKDDDVAEFYRKVRDQNTEMVKLANDLIRKHPGWEVPEYSHFGSGSG